MKHQIAKKFENLPKSRKPERRKGDKEQLPEAACSRPLPTNEEKGKKNRAKQTERPVQKQIPPSDAPVKATRRAQIDGEKYVRTHESGKRDGKGLFGDPPDDGQRQRKRHSDCDFRINGAAGAFERKRIHEHRNDAQNDRREKRRQL